MFKMNVAANIFPVILIIIILTINSETKDSAELMARMKECARGEGLDPEVFSSSADIDVTKDPKLKCYYKCTYLALGLMDKDGKLNETAFRIQANMTPQNKEKDAELENCMKIKESINICEKAYAIQECSIKARTNQKG